MRLELKFQRNDKTQKKTRDLEDQNKWLLSFGMRTFFGRFASLTAHSEKLDGVEWSDELC
jgi:hypothetical protein